MDKELKQRIYEELSGIPRGDLTKGELAVLKLIDKDPDAVIDAGKYFARVKSIEVVHSKAANQPIIRVSFAIEDGKWAGKVLSVSTVNDSEKLQQFVGALSRLCIEVKRWSSPKGDDRVYAVVENVYPVI